MQLSVAYVPRMQTANFQHRSIAINHRPPDGKSRGGLTRWKLLRVQAEVDTRLGETISNRQLADCVRLSRFHFARAFRQSTGMSPQKYVFHRRIERAAHLMLSTDATICEIALACGFADQSHLSRRFAEVLGAAPRVWRRERKLRALS